MTTAPQSAPTGRDGRCRTAGRSLAPDRVPGVERAVRACVRTPVNGSYGPSISWATGATPWHAGWFSAVPACWEWSASTRSCSGRRRRFSASSGLPGPPTTVSASSPWSGSIAPASCDATNILADQGVDGVDHHRPSGVRGGAPCTTCRVGCPRWRWRPVGHALPSVAVDQVAGARLAVRHLLDLGHGTVWHIAGPSDWLEARDRIEGWRQTLEEVGAPVPPVMVGDWSARSGYTAGLTLSEMAGVTAVFAANDQMALGLLRAFRERGAGCQPTSVSSGSMTSRRRSTSRPR